MSFGVVSGVGGGIGVLDRVFIVEEKGAVFGVNLGHSCVEVHATIELSFGVVSGVTPSIHVLDGAVLEIFRHLHPHWFEWQNDVFFAQKCIQLIC